MLDKKQVVEQIDKLSPNRSIQNCMKLPSVLDSDLKTRTVAISPADVATGPNPYLSASSFSHHSFPTCPPPSQPQYTLGLSAYGQDPFAHMGSFTHPFSITNLIDPMSKTAEFCYGPQPVGYPASTVPQMAGTVDTTTANYYHTLYSSNNPTSAANL